MLLDYIKEYGNRSFEDVPLNYLDLLAFTTVAVFNFPEEARGAALSKALPLAQKPSIPTKNDEHRIITMGDRNDDELIGLMAQLPRYRDIILDDFKDCYKEGSGQFGAIALHLRETGVIAFRATDTTLTGWNESLQLSLTKPGFAQEHAVEFLLSSASRTQGPLILCGHSKGGNLAQYAASACCPADAALEARIAAIVSFDGPGLSPNQRDTPCYRSLEDRMATFIPKSSFIGHINEHPVGAIAYVDSTEHFTAQHDVYTWKTEGTHFVLHRQTLLGRAVSDAMGLLVDNLDDAQKKCLFDAIFFLPRLQGKQTFDDENRL